MDVFEKVMRNVTITNTCWLWERATYNGYGRVRLGPHGSPSRVVHRIVFEQLRGPIPDGYELDHLCRVRRCVNPDHLEMVTHRENMSRGVLARGETHGSHKLTEAQVTTIRASSGSTKAIARDFGLSAQHVRMIKQRKYWGWLKTPSSEPV